MKLKSKFKHFELTVIIILISLYTLAASLVSLHRFWQFDAFWYDLGIFDETVWKLSRFNLPYITQLAPPLGKIVWADHLNPSAILLAPFYWLTDKVEIILIAQAVFIGLAGLVAFLISRQVIKQSLVRLSLVVSFLGYVGMQNALYTDIHNIVFAVLPFMLTIWALINKRFKLYWLFLLLTIGWQENLAAVAIGLGIFLLLKKDKNIRLGISTILLGLIWALLSFNLVIPFFNQSSYIYQPDFPPNLLQWITRFFVPVNLKLKSILLSLASFGFIPLLSPAAYPLIVEHYLERHVLNMAATRWDLGFHYNALLSPILFLASIEFLSAIQLKKWTRKLLPLWALFTIGLVIFLHRFYLHGPLMLATHPVFYQQTQKVDYLNDFIKKIPTTGLLMTQNNIATHFSHHKVILLNQNIENLKPDIIALDIHPGQNANNFFPLSEAETKKLIDSLLNSPNYQVNKVTDNQYIFSKVSGKQNLLQ